MHRYRILKNETGDVRAIKIGFSWPAFLLNVLWTIANGLWLGTFLILIVLVAGLLLFANTVQASPVLAVGLVIGAATALLVFLGYRGNDWLAAHLESRGYTDAGSIEAPSALLAADLLAAERKVE